MNVRIVVHTTAAGAGEIVRIEAFYDGLRRFTEHVPVTDMFREDRIEALLERIDVARHRPHDDPLHILKDAAALRNFEVHAL